MRQMCSRTAMHSMQFTVGDGGIRTTFDTCISRPVLGGSRTKKKEYYMSLMKSESIGKLVTALAIAKAAFNPVLKLSENPGFKRNGKASKYADLATAIQATEDPLLANGLVVSQFPVNDGERVGALTLLTHESGEYMGESFTLP